MNVDTGWIEINTTYKSKGIVDYQRRIVTDHEPTDTFIQTIKQTRPGRAFFNFTKKFLDDGQFEMVFSATHDSSD